jgi:hypothetical protein
VHLSPCGALRGEGAHRRCRDIIGQAIHLRQAKKAGLLHRKGSSQRRCLKHAFAPRGAMHPGFAKKLIALQIEGVGNAGCPMHPQPRVRKVATCTRVFTARHRKTPGIPARNGFTDYTRSPRRAKLYCHRRLRIKGFVRPGWAERASEDLTPASGVRTTRLPRPQQRRRLACEVFAHGKQSALRPHHTPNAAASTASHPACLTIAIRPLCGTRQS